MVHIRFDQKTVLVLGGITSVIGIFAVLVISLWDNVSATGTAVKALENEMISARQSLVFQQKFHDSGKLLTRQEISLVIDEITKIGAARDVKFLLISPQGIVKADTSKYPVLPIRMSVQSTYQDLGDFLSALEGMSQSVIGIKTFEIQRDPQLLPELRTNVTVEVYLKEGSENG